MSLASAEFFMPWEFACKDKARTPYPTIWAPRWHRLVILTADPIRRMYGSRLHAVSGYRTAEYNEAKRVGRVGSGVAQSSTHVEGEAVDLRPDPIEGRDAVLELHDMVLRAHAVGQLPELGGVGLYPDWIHIDTRKAPDGHLRRWNDR